MLPTSCALSCLFALISSAADVYARVLLWICEGRRLEDGWARLARCTPAAESTTSSPAVSRSKPSSEACSPRPGSKPAPCQFKACARQGKAVRWQTEVRWECAKDTEARGIAEDKQPPAPAPVESARQWLPGTACDSASGTSVPRDGSLLTCALMWTLSLAQAFFRHYQPAMCLAAAAQC